MERLSCRGPVGTEGCVDGAVRVDTPQGLQSQDAYVGHMYWGHLLPLAIQVASANCPQRRCQVDKL